MTQTTEGQIYSSLLNVQMLRYFLSKVWLELKLVSTNQSDVMILMTSFQIRF